MNEPSAFDAYAPAEMARRVEDVGVVKAQLAADKLLALAVLAGAFIALGAAFSTLAVTGSSLGYGMTRVVGGVAFALGLILVVVAGAELFTGNNLIVMAWASRRVGTGALLRNWALAYLGNLAGAVATAGIVFAAKAWDGEPAAGTALKIAAAKCSIAPIQAFLLGVLCNALVCLGVWLCFSARSTTDKILSILPPITAFVALGFEHCVANMYFLPLGLMLKGVPAVVQASGLTEPALAALSLAGSARNLAFVTLGNLVGGGGMVAGVYWFVYLRPKPRGD